jgi:hypothetical protein
VIKTVAHKKQIRLDFNKRIREQNVKLFVRNQVLAEPIKKMTVFRDTASVSLVEFDLRLRNA